MYPKEDESSSMMENPHVVGFLRNTTSFKATEFLHRLHHVTPGRMCLMLKYLMQNEEDSIQVLSEYFGVALAFTALGALIRKMNDTNAQSKEAKKFERMAFESMLRAAMKRLRDLALHAHVLEENSRDIRNARNALLQDKETLQAERLKLLKRVKETEAEIIKMRNTRLEDTKANERAVAIFACKEQAWSNEKKRLMQEIEPLKKNAEMIRVQMKVLRREEKQNCKACEEKERLITDLTGKLGEREFLLMASVEEARVEQHERNELSVKLAIADMIAGDLKEKLAREMQQHKLDHQKYEAIIAEMMAEKQVTEHQAEKLKQELESLQAAAAAGRGEISYQDSSLEKFSKELVKLQQEVEDKQKMVAAMLRKDFAVAEERNRLASDLTFLRAKAKNLERQEERWKRIAEGRDCTIEQSNALTVQQSIGKTLDGKMMEAVEIEKSHADELKNVHSMYMKQIDALQNQVNHYQERVAELEKNIFLHFTDGEQRLFIQDKETCNKGDNSGSMHESGSLGRRDPVEADIGAKELQLSATKQLLVQYIVKGRINGQEVDKWKRLYFAAKRTIETLEKELADNGALPQIVESEKRNRHLRKSEQRHYQEIDAFQRQMRAKDERMEAFRRHLMDMEAESERKQMEIEFLKNSLMQEQGEILETERLQREKERALSIPTPRLLAQESYYCDLENALTTTNDQSDVKEIVMEVKKIDPQVIGRMQIVVGMPDSGFVRSYENGVAEFPTKKIESRRNIEDLPSFHDDFFGGFQDAFLGNKHSTGKFLENLSTGDSKMDIKNAIDAACMEMEKLAETIAEAKEQMLQVGSWPGAYFRQLVDQVAQVSISGQELRKLKSLLFATGEMQSKHMFQRCKAGPSSQQEGKEMEGQCEDHVHKRRTKVDTKTSGQLLPLSSKKSLEKKVSPPYPLKGKHRDDVTRSSSSIRSLLDLMAKDNGSVAEQSADS